MFFAVADVADEEGGDEEDWEGKANDENGVVGAGKDTGVGSFSGIFGGFSFMNGGEGDVLIDDDGFDLSVGDFLTSSDGGAISESDINVGNPII